MAKLKQKTYLGLKTVVELAVTNAIYASENGLIHHNCNDCKRLHLMPDGITPRLWKLSELKASYGKRGDEVPSLINRHPFCRCQLVYLTKGFGFNDKGKLKYVQEGYDAYSIQKAN
jgi:hypothetical protein